MINVLNIKKKEIIAVIVVIAAITIFCLPLLMRADKAYTICDKENRNVWYDYYHNAAFFYNSVFVYHQFPFWCPSYEGGIAWQSAPIDLSLNPFSLLILLFGPVKGLNLGWYVFYMLSGLSMLYLTRHLLRFDIFGAVCAAIIFPMSSYFPYMQECGYITAREMLLLPLLTVFFLKAKDKNKYILFSAMVAALILYQATLFYAVVFLFLFILTILHVLFQGKGDFRVLKRCLIVFFSVVCLSLLLSAFKILPTLRLLSIDNRPSGFSYAQSELYSNSLKSLWERMFVQGKIFPGGFYIGYVVFFLFLSSSIVLFKRLKIWIVLFCIFIWLSFGENALIDLNYVLWHFPIFKSIKEIAQYYGVIALFALSIITGGFFWILRSFLKGKLNIAVSGSIVAAVFLNLLWANAPFFNVYNTVTSAHNPAPSLNSQVRQVSFWWGDEGGLPVLRYALYEKGYGMTNFHYTFNKLFAENPNIPRYYVLPQFAFLTPGSKVITLKNPLYKGEVFLKKLRIVCVLCALLRSISLYVLVSLSRID